MSVFIHAEGMRYSLMPYIHYTILNFRRGGSNTDCFYIPRDEGTRTRKCRKAGGKFAASHQFNQNFLPTIFFPSLPKLVNKVGEKGSPFNLILKRGIGLILSTLKDIGTLFNLRSRIG